MHYSSCRSRDPMGWSDRAPLGALGTPTPAMSDKQDSSESNKAPEHPLPTAIAPQGNGAAPAAPAEDSSGAEIAKRRDVPSLRWLLAFVPAGAGIAAGGLRARAIARSDT